MGSPTFLEDRGSVDLYNSGFGIFVSLAITHGENGQLLSFINGRCMSVGGFDDVGCGGTRDGNVARLTWLSEEVLAMNIWSKKHTFSPIRESKATLY